VDARPPPPLLQPFHDFRSPDRQPVQMETQNIKMPGGFAVGENRRSLDFLALRESIRILPGNACTETAHFRALVQLDKTDRRLNVGKVVLEPRVEYFVIPGTFTAIALP